MHDQATTSGYLNSTERSTGKRAGLTVEEVWGDGDGGTELKVSAEQPAESLAHVC
jgi:hypothetical protein